MIFPIAHSKMENIELTLRCASAPTKHPAVSTIKNMTRRSLNRLFSFPSFGLTATPMNVGFTMAVVIFVVFNKRLMAI